MIVIVSMATLEDYNAGRVSVWHYKRRFERLCGWPVAAVHYTEAKPEYVARIQPRALFITGFGQAWETFHVPDLYAVNDLLHSIEVPVYGACGGHQLIGYCFGKNLRQTKQLRNEPMRKLKPGEPDLGPVSGDWGYYVARGVQEVEIVKRDPLFSGLRGKKIRVPQSHYCEVKALPPDFELLASSPECRIEMMKHATRPIYGAQFHAEVCEPPYTDGDKIMTNFFRLAGLEL
jgi:GMP synthase (glutamine-hydrolysing)